MHVALLNLGSKMTIYLTWKAQIILLVVEKVTILDGYSDFVDIFLNNQMRSYSSTLMVTNILSI